MLFSAPALLHLCPSWNCGNDGFRLIFACEVGVFDWKIAKNNILPIAKAGKYAYNIFWSPNSDGSVFATAQIECCKSARDIKEDMDRGTEKYLSV